MIEGIEREVKRDDGQSPLGGGDDMDKGLDDSDGSVNEEIPDDDEASH